MIHIIRYDDFSAASHSVVEAGLFEIFLERQIPCTVAAIPFVCEPENLLKRGEVKLSPFPKEKAGLLEPLLKAGLAEVALHGFSHLALAPLRQCQEFSDAMPMSAQRELIRRGRRHLEEIFCRPVNLFVPPWNRLGVTTAAVLREEGLMASGEVRADHNQDFNLAQAPCAALIQETERALYAAQKFGGEGALVGTMIHDYDFVESGYQAGSLTLTEFAAAARAWSKLAQVKQMLVTEAILDNREPVSERARANAQLRRNLEKSFCSRRLLSRAQGVYWNTREARRFAALAGLLP